MTDFEVGIWQAAFAVHEDAAMCQGVVMSFRAEVANGTAGLPVSEGNVCDHKLTETIKVDRGFACAACHVLVPDPVKEESP